MLAINNKLTGSVFSSALAELSISSSEEYCFLNILAGPSATPLYSEKLWVHEGSVYAYKLNEIIENYMRRENQISLLVAISVTDDSGQHDSMAVNVFYCDAVEISDNNAKLFFENNFLTTLQTRRVPVDADFALLLYSQNRDMERFSIKCFFSVDDSQEVTSYEVSGEVDDLGDQVFAVPLTVPKIITESAAFANVPEESLKLKSFTVSCGARYAVFFVDHSLKFCDSFIFKNIYNAIDWIVFPAVSDHKTEVSRSLATLPLKSVFYDRNVTKSVEVQSGPLTADEAEFIGQLAAAHEAFRMVPVANAEIAGSVRLREILVSDSEISFSDDDKNNSIKFSWRFADNKPAAILSSPGRVFSYHYNQIFS